MDIGELLDVLTVAGADTKPLFESFNKSALENVITGLEKIKSTKETRDVIETVYDNVNELLGKRSESPATSSNNTKQGTVKQSVSSTLNST